MVTHIAQSDTKLVNSVVDRVTELKSLKADLNTREGRRVQEERHVRGRPRQDAGQPGELQGRIQRPQEEGGQAARTGAPGRDSGAEGRGGAQGGSGGRQQRQDRRAPPTRKTTTTTERKHSSGDRGLRLPGGRPQQLQQHLRRASLRRPDAQGHRHLHGPQHPAGGLRRRGTITSTSPTDTGLGGITIHLKSGNTTYYYAHLSSIKSGIHAGVRVTPAT